MKKTQSYSLAYRSLADDSIGDVPSILLDVDHILHARTPYSVWRLAPEVLDAKRRIVYSLSRTSLARTELQRISW